MDNIELKGKILPGEMRIVEFNAYTVYKDGEKKLYVSGLVNKEAFDAMKRQEASFKVSPIQSLKKLFAEKIETYICDRNLHSYREESKLPLYYDDEGKVYMRVEGDIYYVSDDYLTACDEFGNVWNIVLDNKFVNIVRNNDAFADSFNFLFVSPTKEEIYAKKMEEQLNFEDPNSFSHLFSDTKPENRKNQGKVVDFLAYKEAYESNHGRH